MKRVPFLKQSHVLLSLQPGNQLLTAKHSTSQGQHARRRGVDGEKLFTLHWQHLSSMLSGSVGTKAENNRKERDGRCRSTHSSKHMLNNAGIKIYWSELPSVITTIMIRGEVIAPSFQ